MSFANSPLVAYAASAKMRATLNAPGLSPAHRELMQKSGEEDQQRRCGHICLRAIPGETGRRGTLP